MKKIGVISVDSGLCWIGDPCYILHKENPPKDIGENWNGFCNKLTNKDIRQFYHNAGHVGLGICTSTNGDGCYPVFANINKKGEITSIKIKFI